MRLSQGMTNSSGNDEVSGTAPAAEASARTGYGLNPLDRKSGRRDDAAHIDTLWAAPSTRCLVFAGNDVVLTGLEPATEALFATSRLPQFGEFAERLFLGVGPQGAVFAVRFAEAAALPPGSTTSDLRSTATRGLVAPELLGALGGAKSLLNWHARNRFCANCGTPSTIASSGWRRVCPSCGAQHFPRVDPVVIMLVARGEACLLGRAPRFGPGMYSCLAGFVEPGETAEDAVRREVMEETAVRVGRVTYLATQPWPFPGSLMIGCLAEAESEAVTIDRSELEDARWFSRDEVHTMLARTHPDGLVAPQPVAVAHTLLTHWAGG